MRRLWSRRPCTNRWIDRYCYLPGPFSWLGEELLSALHDRLNEGDAPWPRIIVLHGLGGSGKTSVAVEYAHQQLAADGIAWQFPAQDLTLLAAGFSRLAVQLGTSSGSLDQRDPVASVHAVLADTDTPWLLLFDNAEDQDSVRAFLPPAGHGQVLITSQSALWAPSQAVEVPVLEAQVAASFLITRTGDHDEQSAALLANLYRRPDRTRLPPSLDTEIIPRLFRILLERCPAAGLRPDRPGVSYRTRALGGEAYAGNMLLTLAPAEGRDHTLISTWPVRPGQSRLVISREKGGETAMAHPNEDLLRRGYEAFGSGDMDTVLALFDDDIVWHEGGSNQISGDYHGHQEVMGFFGKLMELSGGTFHLDIHDIVANDTHGVVLATAHGERDGKTLASRAADIWHLADGKAMEFWTFAEDQAAIDKFFC